MRTKFKGLWTLLLALVVQISFAQQKQVSGTVTDAASGDPLPGVNILVKGTNNGTTTDFDGKFKISVKPEDVLVFSYIGYQPVEIKVGNQNVINVKMNAGETLQEVVMDISGEKKEIKTLSYAVQKVKAEKLEISDISNVASALSGKVAGAQVWEQAGSKLGSRPKIRLRGRISLNQDSDPLYVVDGIIVEDPTIIDPDDIASIEVLKGPNATAIYGQRGENGVVVMTTKSAQKGKFGVSINSKVSFENVAYLPKYQNWYGQGYLGKNDWGVYNSGGSISYYNVFFGPITHSLVDIYPGWGNAAFQGANFIITTLGDESWGPKFDGRDYMPWYAWIPDSPYFGQTAKWEAHPDNIKNFFDKGIYIKNNIALTSATDKYSARVSFSSLNQKGIVPFSTYDRYSVVSNFKYDVSKRLNVGVSAIYTQYKRHGDFNDDYANQTTGSFNQWFARDLDMAKEKELIDLKTPEGYYATWNWWGPAYLSLAANFIPRLVDGFKHPVFWYNHYTWLKEYDNNGLGNIVSGNIWAKYKINDNWSAKIIATRYQTNRGRNFHMPYAMEWSSPFFDHIINSFGLQNSQYVEDNYSAYLFYKNDLTEDINLDVMMGSNYRVNNYHRERTWMSYSDRQNGLIIPDLYRFDNTKNPVPTNLEATRKKVVSLYGKATFGYQDLLFLEVTGRQDWSSALFPDHNGYFYPSAGLTFNFGNLESIKDNKVINSGKFRIGWAQVGSDVDAHLIYPRYRILGGIPYEGNAMLVAPSYFVDPELKPALNSSFETGVDMSFLNGRLGFDFTYYYEKRKDEIIFQAVSPATGYSSYLTNGGTSHRSGIELSVNTIPVQTKDFRWNLDFNFAKNKTIIDDVPGDQKEMIAPGGRWWSDGDSWGRIVLVHHEGDEWGQIKGREILKDENGNPVLSPNGLYVPNDSLVYFGSVLPDFNGGIGSKFTYKNISLALNFTFQKGGKFYSGTEIWGYYSGLLEETGLDGNREAGKEVSGVDANGNPVTYTVDAQSYFKQFADNDIVEPFIHDASYLKLKEMSLTYTLPKKLLGNYVKGLSVSLIGTNVWLIAVSKDNKHRWDPSELSQAYGEDGQLPGTRRYGLNIKLTF